MHFSWLSEEKGTTDFASLWPNCSTSAVLQEVRAIMQDVITGSHAARGAQTNTVHLTGTHLVSVCVSRANNKINTFEDIISKEHCLT